MVDTRPAAKTTTNLTDGRSLFYFDDKAGGDHPELDTRALGAFSSDSELRFDPFAMLPFTGYNMSDYFQHWLDIGKSLGKSRAALPKIYCVNWFRKGADGKFIWPGFGENLRVLEWMIKRVDGRAGAIATSTGGPCVLARSRLPSSHRGASTDSSSARLFASRYSTWSCISRKRNASASPPTTAGPRSIRAPESCPATTRVTLTSPVALLTATSAIQADHAAP